MSQFKPYPAYKDSGIEWADQLPADWISVKLKRVARLQSGEFITSESIDVDGDYPVYGGNGLRGYTDTNTHEGEYALIGRQGALCGNINYSKGSFWASEHAVVVYPEVGIITRWLGELLRSMNLGQYSVSAAQPGLSVERIADLFIPVPTQLEQTQIARFLDYETARIDALIEEQKHLIELLKEKRQAVISHAVTKGFDPTVPMKDSGVEWLGEVPAHWTLAPIKHLALLNPNKSSFSGETSQLCSFLPMDKLKLGDLQLDEERPINEVINGYTYFQDWDLLQAKVTPCFENKNIAIAKGLTNGIGFGSSEINVFRPFSNVDVSYLYYRLQEDAYMSICVSSMTGAGGLKRVPTDVINNFVVAVPGQSEQIEIGVFLDNEIIKVSSLIKEALVGVELLQERRYALISAAVYCLSLKCLFVLGQNSGYKD